MNDLLAESRKHREGEIEEKTSEQQPATTAGWWHKKGGNRVWKYSCIRGGALYQPARSRSCIRDFVERRRATN